MNVHRTTGAFVIALCAFCPSLAQAQGLAQDLAPFVPPPCVAGQEMFTDVPASNPFCPWVEQLARDHITGGCGPQLYCPGAPLTRAQMSVFLELAMRGTDTWFVNADLLDGMNSTEFVTTVSAGTGLSGGGSGGTLTLDLEGPYQLPQACSGGQHPEWTGSAWVCGSPGTGTVTSVGTGAGLTGGPVTTSGTVSVAPGGITSAMIADGTVGSADVADGSIGAADVAPTQVQLRVAQACAATDFLRAINADGTVTCGPDLDSGGTVTSVATGAGLTGGPITGSGTLSVAPGGITGAMIADGTVGGADVADGSIGAADVASAQVQLRVSQACTTSEFMRGVNADGTVACGGDAGHEHYGQTWTGSTSAPGLTIDNTLGIGVYGVAASGLGVLGEALAETGQGTGVFGQSSSTSGTGVAGFAGASTGINYGVLGSANSPDGYAGWFSGRVLVTGNLFVAGTKSFKIDHPLDPANRYLVHAAIESSEVLNMYSGTVVLDGSGTAVVQLPDWFEALNRDFRYQLTCVGGYAPVYIASEIQDGRFSIAGGQAGLKVSWQVVGTRSDAHAVAHPMVVDEEKPVEERGTYLDPEAHGQPVELGRDYKVTSALRQE